MFIIKRVLLLTLAIGLAACEQANILAPTHNLVEDEKPAHFAVEFSKGAGIPVDLNLQLNAADVTDLFTVTATGAEATGATLADYVFPGLNTFRVVAFQQIKQIEFYYDQDGPVIHLLDTDKANKVVSGYVNDMAGVKSLTLDGQAVALNENNEFSVSYTDAPFNTFVAVDGFNHESSTTFARNDNTFTGLSARLNQGGLDFLVHVLEEEINTTDFNALAQSVGSTQLLNLIVLNMKAAVTGLNIDGVDIELEALEDETINGNIKTDNFNVGVRLEVDIFPLTLLTGPILTNVNAKITGLDAGTNVLVDIVDSDLDFALADTTATWDNIAVTYVSGERSNIIQDVFGTITTGVVNFLTPLLKPMVIKVVENTIVPQLSNFLKDIPINLQIVTLAESEEIRVTALPNFLDTKEKGITIDLGTRIWAPTPSPAAPGVLGSLYREGDTPTLGSTTPDGEPFDFGVMISENVVNQALSAAQESGITTLHVSPGFYSNFTPQGIKVFMPEGSEIADNDQIGFRFQPSSAPYIKFQPGRDDSAAGLFVWHDVSFAFDLYKVAWGEYRPIFGITFDLEVPFEVDASTDGYLQIGLEQLPHFRILSQDVTGSIVLPVGFINNSMKFILPMVMPTIAERLKTVPLPRIYQHTVNMNDFWVSGSAANNLALAGDLVPVGVTEAAEPPVTEIDEVTTGDVVVEVESDNTSGLIVINDYITVLNGEVTIDVNTLNGGGSYLDSLEYRYRLDNGAWSIWKHRDEIKLGYLLAGPHAIEICARNAALKIEIACPIVEFDTSVAANTQ